MERAIPPLTSKYDAVSEISEDLGENVGRSRAIAMASTIEGRGMSTIASSDLQRIRTAEHRVQDSETTVLKAADIDDDSDSLLRKEDAILPNIAVRKASLKPDKRHKKESSNPIDELFQGLD